MVYTLNGTETDGLRITSEQKKIMAARFDGISFWEIPESKHQFLVDEIIFTIAASVGATPPESEMLARYLSEEMILAITDFGYSHLTLAEIKLAIRLNLLPILKNPAGEDLKAVATPANICVSFLVAVLGNYCVLRNNLDRLIENKINGH